MPYSVIKENSLIHVRFSGIFNPKDNNDATVELYSQPDINDIEFIIWDFSEVTEMNMTERETGVAATGDKLASSILPNTTIVFITEDAEILELCKTYIAQCRNQKLQWNIHISPNLESARSWIDSQRKHQDK